jgi:hypothetical protein
VETDGNFVNEISSNLLVEGLWTCMLSICINKQEYIIHGCDKDCELIYRILRKCKVNDVYELLKIYENIKYT